MSAFREEPSDPKGGLDAAAGLPGDDEKTARHARAGHLAAVGEDAVDRDTRRFHRRSPIVTRRELYLERLTPKELNRLAQLFEKALPGVVGASVWPPPPKRSASESEPDTSAKKSLPSATKRRRCRLAHSTEPAQSADHSYSLLVIPR
ncbi:MAG: hypothetical protein ACXVRV_12725 [Gaiellaceae bacterium]